MYIYIYTQAPPQKENNKPPKTSEGLCTNCPMDARRFLHFLNLWRESEGCAARVGLRSGGDSGMIADLSMGRFKGKSEPETMFFLMKHGGIAVSFPCIKLFDE